MRSSRSIPGASGSCSRPGVRSIPRERFGTTAEPVPPALARVRDLDRAPDHALYPQAQAGGAALPPIRSFCRTRRWAPSAADLFWVPEHDTRRGPNVITTLTAPHSFTARRLQQLRASVPPDIAALPRPRVAVMLGGPNGDYHYTPAALARLASALQSLVRLGARPDDHAVAAHAGGGHGVRAGGDGGGAPACSGTAAARTPIRSSWPTPMPSSRRRTPST